MNPMNPPPFPMPLVSILQKTEIINTLMTHTDCNDIFIFESYVIGLDRFNKNPRRYNQMS